MQNTSTVIVFTITGIAVGIGIGTFIGNWMARRSFRAAMKIHARFEKELIKEQKELLDKIAEYRKKLDIYEKAKNSL